MRILLVANTLPPQDLSGAGEQVLQLAFGLESAGHEVAILGRGRSGARGPKVLFPLTVVPAAWRTLRGFRPAVVQVHESDGALVALLVILLRRFLNPRPQLLALLQVSYCEEIRAVRALRHGGRVLGRPSATEQRFRWFKGPLQALFGGSTAWMADRVLAPSSTTAREIERDYRVQGVAVLPNVTGGDLTRFGIPASAAAGTAQATDLAPGYLLYVGRLRIRKGVEVLLEAIALLRQSFPAVRLLIVGQGEHHARLRQKAEALGLHQAVRWLGRADAVQVREWLSTAACLVVPSTYEGMPLVVLEAMAAGLPVVASQVSGIPEVVVAGETGWLVPPEDPPALAAALSEVLRDPDAVRTRGAAGRDRVLRYFQPQHAATRWLEVVASLPAGGGGPGAP